MANPLEEQIAAPARPNDAGTDSAAASAKLFSESLASRPTTTSNTDVVDSLGGGQSMTKGFGLVGDDGQLCAG
jgi:hypothetical protein